MRPRGSAITLAALLMIAGCANAPEPGSLAAFCSLLESGSGLTSTPTSTDLELLAAVAPPAIRPTIEVLQDRARDFDELLAEDPPDLEALFNARFDPAARADQADLDAYAENSCGIEVARPPSTRWNNYARENHGGEPWVDLVTAQFDVASDRIEAATLVFADAPEPIGLVEDACRAVSAFLVADGADPGRVQVLIGSVVALDSESSDAVCRLP